MTTKTRYQQPQVAEEAIEELQKAVVAANSTLFDVGTRLVRSQQQLAEAGVKFWFATFTAQFPR